MQLLTIQDLTPNSLLNIGVFAFIGLLIWLYFKKEPGGNKTEGEKHT